MILQRRQNVKTTTRKKIFYWRIRFLSSSYKKAQQQYDDQKEVVASIECGVAKGAKDNLNIRKKKLRTIIFTPKCTYRLLRMP
mmetsp:Transcript_7791/g.10869  ORF Transcript_7791/g.10869 Transcript_7791/m.10869 type:complete len:83 (-) Transcript_7791:1710-1958(-)